MEFHSGYQHGFAVARGSKQENASHRCSEARKHLKKRFLRAPGVQDAILPRVVEQEE